jgi:hypothetical protein
MMNSGAIWTCGDGAGKGTVEIAMIAHSRSLSRDHLFHQYPGWIIQGLNPLFNAV